MTNEMYEIAKMGGNVLHIPFHQRPRGIFYTETTGGNYDNICPKRPNPPIVMTGLFPVALNRVNAIPFEDVCVQKLYEEIQYPKWKLSSATDIDKINSLRRKLEEEYKKNGPDGNYLDEDIDDGGTFIHPQEAASSSPDLLGFNEKHLVRLRSLSTGSSIGFGSRQA